MGPGMDGRTRLGKNTEHALTRMNKTTPTLEDNSRSNRYAPAGRYSGCFS